MLISLIFAFGISSGYGRKVQGQPPIDAAILMGKRIQSFKKIEAPLVAVILNEHVQQRSDRGRTRTTVNRTNRGRVASAPEIVVKKQVTSAVKNHIEYVDTKLTDTQYLANVTIRVVSDRSDAAPLPDLPVAYVQRSKHESLPLMLFRPESGSHNRQKAPAVQRTSPKGMIVVKDVAVPSTISVSLPKEARDQWSIDSEKGEGEDIAIVGEGSGPIIRSDQKWKLISSTKKGNKIYRTYKKSETRRLNITADEPVVVRREVADFVMPRMIDIASLRGQTPSFYIGDQEIKPEDGGPNWRFRIKRDLLSDENAKLAINYQTNHGEFFGEMNVAKPDFYQDNQLPAPVVSLESFPENSVVVANKPVDETYRISPMQVLTSSGADEITGQDALQALGVSKIASVSDPGEAVKKQLTEYRFVPGPGKEDGRYGEWIVLNDRGIVLRCRWDPDEGNAGKTGKGRKFLPGRKSDGLLEAIRVTKPEGGSVAGVLRVGATKQEVFDAFGSPDRSDIDPYQILDMQSSNDRGRSMFGDKDLEGWDDSYLYGGIRIKWEAGQVKWFEIARPVQLLYNGTKAFNPPEGKAIYVADVRGPDTYSNRIRVDLMSFVSKASGVQLASSEADADMILAASYNLDVQEGMTYHQHKVKVPKRDRKGKIEYDKKGNMKTEDQWVNESFQCPSVTATASLNATLTDRATSGIERISLPASSSSDSGPHTEGQVCVRPSARSAIEGALSGKNTSEKSWQRSFVNAVARGVNTSGTVIAVNYKTGQMLINLGENNGIHEKGDEGTEMWLFLLTDVDVKTGVPKGDLNDTKLIGGKGKSWLEVQKVGPTWCVVQPKTKDGMGHTTTDWGVIPRIVDPGSGLVRVQVVPKRGR